MMMTVAKAFLDTNILLRATIPQFPLYQEVKTFVSTYIEAGTELWISRQVIREYCNQVTRPQLFMQPMTPAQIDHQYKTMQTFFQVADETEAVTAQFIKLLHQYPTGGKQVHDANIVATMLVYRIDTLLTLNVEDMKRFSDQIKVISP